MRNIEKKDFVALNKYCFVIYVIIYIQVFKLVFVFFILMDTATNLFTRDLKRSILIDGLDALLLGRDVFNEWADGYYCNQETTVPSEMDYLGQFRYFVNTGLSFGFRPFNPRSSPKEVEKILDALEEE